jgi:hypothetical protein
MLASGAAVFLVWTGLALALRRFARFLRGAVDDRQSCLSQVRSNTRSTGTIACPPLEEESNA